jgi:hypothetical protein
VRQMSVNRLNIEILWTEGTAAKPMAKRTNGRMRKNQNGSCCKTSKMALIMPLLSKLMTMLSDALDYEHLQTANGYETIAIGCSVMCIGQGQETTVGFDWMQ